MTAPALNLLRCPRRVPEVWGRAGFWLVGALTGLGLAGLWQQWQTHQLQTLQLRHAALKEAVRIQNAAKAEQAQQQQTAQIALRMTERARDWPACAQGLAGRGSRVARTCGALAHGCSKAFRAAVVVSRRSSATQNGRAHAGRTGALDGRRFGRAGGGWCGRGARKHLAIHAIG